jgi:TolB-like protein/DNA-binding winged helix-turn-helix (wHTH) protein
VDKLDAADIYLFEGFRFDRAGGCLFRTNGSDVAEPVALGSRALALLGLLVEHQGRLVTKDEIFAAVWHGSVVEEANLTVQVSALRRILDRDRLRDSCIQTNPGRGYRFVAPVTRAESVTLPSTSRYGADSGGLIVAERQPKPPLPERLIDELSPPPRPAAPHWPGHAVIAAITGALCLLVGVVVAVNWRSLSPWESGAAPRLSIVVLPISNLNRDPDQQYFADALTEDVTTDLSQIAQMFVISSSTAFKLKDKAVDTKEIGRRLGVHYVLEGSVERSGNRIRVNVQLINAESDAHLWAERFDRVAADLFSLEDEITRRIAAALDARLILAETARPTERPDAVDYILRGRAARLNPSAPGVYAQAIGMFERALSIDSNSAEAKIRLAQALVFRALDGMSSAAKTDIARAGDLVDQALAARPRSPLAHSVKAQVLRAQNLCAEAIPEFEMAIASNGNLAGAYAGLGGCKLSTGSIDETIPLEEKAIQLSPRDAAIGLWYWRIGVVHLLQSRTDDAVRWFEMARVENPAHPLPHLYLAAAYGLKREIERAAGEIAEARRLDRGDFFTSIARLRAFPDAWWGTPKVRALYEATYFTGLRKAGVPEE